MHTAASRPPAHSCQQTLASTTGCITLFTHPGGRWLLYTGEDYRVMCTPDEAKCPPKGFLNTYLETTGASG